MSMHPACVQERLPIDMRTIEITGEQIADVAREIARGFGHQDPDIMVFPGPAAQVKDPFTCYGALFLFPNAENAFPLWHVFVGAAECALARVGRLANVTFTILDKREIA